MRLPAPPLHPWRRLVLTAALLGAGLAQAAGLAITSGRVAGGLDFQAEANGTQFSNSASVADVSGPTALRGLGTLSASNGLSTGGTGTTVSQQWVASALLNADNAMLLAFAIGANSTLLLRGDGQFDSGTEQTSVLLDAELAVARP